jgi:hypothetical protein
VRLVLSPPFGARIGDYFVSLIWDFASYCRRWDACVGNGEKGTLCLEWVMWLAVVRSACLVQRCWLQTTGLRTGVLGTRSRHKQRAAHSTLKAA